LPFRVVVGFSSGTEDTMKLYRLEYSCYARKAQMVLDLLGVDYECIDVAFGDRSELAERTGGYIQVPVLVEDAGAVIVDSRAICAELVSRESGRWLVPSPWQGPIWAYADWCDGPLEDVMFRIATPLARRRFFTDPWERALYVFVKERKFGKGCVDEWERTHDDLVARAAELLAPSCVTLAQTPFLFGAEPTLADAALYGELVMLEFVDAGLPARLGPDLPGWMRRLEAKTKR
jgi:glutathione S-transferase